MNAAKQQGDDVELETTEGEQQRGAEMCCERVLTSGTNGREKQKKKNPQNKQEICCLRKRF